MLTCVFAFVHGVCVCVYVCVLAASPQLPRLSDRAVGRQRHEASRTHCSQYLASSLRCVHVLRAACMIDRCDCACARVVVQARTRAGAVLRSTATMQACISNMYLKHVFETCI